MDKSARGVKDPLIWYQPPVLRFQNSDLGGSIAQLQHISHDKIFVRWFLSNHLELTDLQMTE